jgi:hypothetical protein
VPFRRVARSWFPVLWRTRAISAAHRPSEDSGTSRSRSPIKTHVTPTEQHRRQHRDDQTISKASTAYLPRSKSGLMSSESEVGSTRAVGCPVITWGDTFRTPQRTVADRNVTVFGRTTVRHLSTLTYSMHVLAALVGKSMPYILGATRGERPKSGHSELRQGLVPMKR